MRPYQPKLSIYPKIISTQNPKGVPFKQQWFYEYSWLEYRHTTNLTFCFYCRHFGQANDKSYDSTFSREGYGFFRKATDKFKNHQKSKAHLLAIEMHTNRINKKQKTVVAQIDSTKEIYVKKYWQYMEIIIDHVAFLTRQGLALRGHNESMVSKNRGNFKELMNFSSQKVAKGVDELFLKEMMSKRFNYLSPNIQNEIIGLLADEVTKQILPKKTSYFSIMVDETTDMSVHEQVSICLRYCNDSLEVKEQFFGKY